MCRGAVTKIASETNKEIAIIITNQATTSSTHNLTPTTSAIHIHFHLVNFGLSPRNHTLLSIRFLSRTMLTILEGNNKTFNSMNYGKNRVNILIPPIVENIIIPPPPQGPGSSGKNDTPIQLKNTQLLRKVQMHPALKIRIKKNRPMARLRHTQPDIAHFRTVSDGMQNIFIPSVAPTAFGTISHVPPPTVLIRKELVLTTEPEERTNTLNRKRAIFRMPSRDFITIKVLKRRHSRSNFHTHMIRNQKLETLPVPITGLNNKLSHFGMNVIDGNRPQSKLTKLPTPRNLAICPELSGFTIIHPPFQPTSNMIPVTHNRLPKPRGSVRSFHRRKEIITTLVLGAKNPSP
ncbi:putative ribonuclease H protein [Senna tora]|uniref:Putative ribonuclease H protein n=1 Tax=Senna tora TaxID=362788 RepID=A0A834WZ02_9FABA|nr:putative ribonuclease H protein [Senna tora]